MKDQDKLIPSHGGYRRLRSFRAAQWVYALTVIFCDRFIRRNSRTHDQMVQAARSGVQNIAEGSVASATSKKMELKLTGVARASLEELILCLTHQASYLLRKQLQALERQFLQEGGFTERLYQNRQRRRGH